MVVIVFIILVLLLPVIAVVLTSFFATDKSKKRCAFVAFLLALNLEFIYFKVDGFLNEKYSIVDDGWDVVSVKTQYGSHLSKYDWEFEIQRGDYKHKATNILEVAENDSLVVGICREQAEKQEYFLIDSQHDSIIFANAFADLGQNVFTRNDLINVKQYLEQQRSKVEGDNYFNLKLIIGTLIISLLVTSFEYGIVCLFRKYLRDWR